jgi:class 3 adenylate cyclase
VSTCAVCGYEAADAFNFCPDCGEPAVPIGQEQRKVVTVLRCDVVGSTKLGEAVDPEALRALLARYFVEMKEIIERHGGTVEKFIGDAVMAVFGVPLVHEDDALRACRAAIEMREALPALGVEGRIGLMTGEVVTGTEERIATGDVVNVAARLEQAAGPGEVLIGEPTFELVRAAVQVDSLEPLRVKGKAQPVEAYQLNAVHEPRVRRAQTHFVGREQELSLIQTAWKRALTEQRCQLVTIVGEAGVGKSRLVTEALASLETRLVQGCCLPYGAGITYWPVVEIIKQLDALPNHEAAAAAIGSLLGETDVATSADEIAWAVRKLLEEQAPLIAVFDDIQWGEETFLDLLEHVALLSSGAPILLLAMARPELTERRAEWPVMIRLEPLGAAEAEELIPQGISSELRAQIAHAAGGNPLFVEEMVAVAGDPRDEVVVPPTLRALLATRLDQLDSAERSVLEWGAIEGEVFHCGAVQALALEESQVTPRLAALVRKGLIRPEKAQLAGEDGFRFRHLLIRDAAYAGLSKATRADLHQRFAAWLENRGTDLVELEEILGYHLERAWRYRGELRLADDGELAAAARRRLTAAGRRALSRQDYGAAANLLERATALVPEAEIDVPVELNLASALVWGGKGREGLEHASSVAERAAIAGDRPGELCAQLEEGIYRAHLEPEEETIDQLAALAELALPVFEEAGDDFALHVAYCALGQVSNLRGKQDALVVAYERAIAHARRVGFPNQSLIAWCGVGRLRGTTPVSELLAWQDEQDERDRRNPWFRAHRAETLAMLGRFAEARTLVDELQADLAERGAGVTLALTSVENVLEVELLADDPAAAVTAGEDGCRGLEDLGQFGVLSGGFGCLARAYYALGRLEEAEAWAGRAAKLGASDDVLAQILWRPVKAKVLARRGEHAEAERLGREAVALRERTDVLNMQGEPYADLAEVLAMADRPNDSAEALEQALARYERKENVVMAERVRARLAVLRRSETPAERG